LHPSHENKIESNDIELQVKIMKGQKRGFVSQYSARRHMVSG
jgi:hypothetical protein